MPEKIRQTFRDRRVRLRQKKGTKRLRKPDAGINAIYRNPHAIPVSPTIRERGQRTPFALENAEWVLRQKPFTETLYRTIYFGLVKFKGISRPQRCLLKQLDYHENPQIQEIIRRLDRSNVYHPKMAAIINSPGDRWIIMEPFVTTWEGTKATKFLYGVGCLVRKTNLADSTGAQTFRKIARATAMLAKAGLKVVNAKAHKNDPRVDIFNLIRTSSGELKLIVQDLENLELGENPQENWSESRESLLKVIRSTGPTKEGTARAILSEAAREHGLE